VPSVSQRRSPVSLLSISYSFYSQAMSVAKQRNDYRRLPRSTSAQLFLCIMYHVCWVIGATGMLVGESALGPLRWLGPLLLLVYGGGNLAVALIHIDVVPPILILASSMAFCPMLSIIDHVLTGPPVFPAFYDSSPIARAMPILRRVLRAGMYVRLGAGARPPQRSHPPVRHGALARCVRHPRPTRGVASWRSDSSRQPPRSRGEWRPSTAWQLQHARPLARAGRVQPRALRHGTQALLARAVERGEVIRDGRAQRWPPARRGRARTHRRTCE
jgi:hypothetical protein